MNKRIALSILIACSLASTAAVHQPSKVIVAVQNPQFCIVIAMDKSGSMKGNDPSFLRNTSAKLLISLLDVGDQVAVIQFADEPVMMAQGFEKIDQLGDKDHILDLVINKVPAGYTDIYSALAKAVDLFQYTHCQKRDILLLTDGKPELPGGLPVDYQNKTISLIQNSNVRIVGISLTPAGESELLYHLAEVSEPQGTVIPARSASDLIDSFLYAYSVLKDRTVLGEGVFPLPEETYFELASNVAPYVTRVTFVLGKPENGKAQFGFFSPNESFEPFYGTSFSYTADPGFVVSTIDHPSPGKWGYQLDGSGEARFRIVLHSRLRISTLISNYQPVGENILIQAILREESASGESTTLIGPVSFSAKIILPDGTRDIIDTFYDDGSNGDQVSGDGIFTASYPNTHQIGIYHIQLLAYKGPIPVEQSATVDLVPFPRLSVSNRAVFEARGQPMTLAADLSGAELFSFESGTAIAHVTLPDGTEELIRLADTGGRYTGQYVPKQEGEYQVEYRVENSRYKGTPFSPSASERRRVILVTTVQVKEQKIDLGKIDTDQLLQGVPWSLHVTSTGAEEIQVHLRLEDAVPCLSLMSTDKEISPGDAELRATISGQCTPGDYNAVISFSSNGNVDVINGSVPIKFTLLPPMVEVTATGDLTKEFLDKNDDHHLSVTLDINSKSSKRETLHLILKGFPTAIISPEQVVVEPGQTLTVPLEIELDATQAGEYQGEILISGREELQIQPEAVRVEAKIIHLSWMQKWGWIGIGFGALMLFVLAQGIAFFNRRPRPWGTMKSVKVPPGCTAITPVSLARSTRGFFNHDVLVGSGVKSGLKISGGKVLPRHAMIRAEKVKLTERVGKPPRAVRVERLSVIVTNLSTGRVLVNQAPVAKGQQSMPLKNGMRVTFGDYEFEYQE